MPELMTTIEIDAPASRVWDELMDLEHWPHWNFAVRQLRGPINEGRTTRAELSVFGLSVPIDVQITRIDPERELSWVGPGRMFRQLASGEHFFRLEALSAERTRMVQGERFSGPGMPLIWRPLAPELHHLYGRSNEALKARVEAKRAG